MKIKPSILSSAALLALLAFAAPSGAQTPTPAPSHKPDALSQTASDLFDRGGTASTKGQWDVCRASFLAAWNIKKRAEIAGNLAFCEAKLGMSRDAAEHAAYFLRTATKGTPNERASAEHVLSEARKKVATVSVKVDPADAEVRIDDQFIGRGPFLDPFFLEPGKHTIEARRDDYETARASVEAKPGDAQDVPLVCKSAGHASPVVIGGAVLTGLSLGAGVVFAVLSSSKASSASQALATLTPGPNACASHGAVCAAIDSDLSAHDTLGDAAVGAFVGAAVLGAATTVYALAGGRPAQKQGLRVLPVVTAAQHGLAVAGTW
jgi:PEGA domain